MIDFDLNDLSLIDWLKVFYDADTNARPINVAYVSPSVATWRNMNPSYRIFTIDGDYDGSSHVSLIATRYFAQLRTLFPSPAANSRH